MAKRKSEAAEEREFWRDELREAANVISFLHNCLVNSREYSYEYPKQTTEALQRINQLAPPEPMCFHGRFYAGCRRCAIVKAITERRHKFRRLLRAARPKRKAKVTRGK